jgi:hypothetical protein
MLQLFCVEQFLFFLRKSGRNTVIQDYFNLIFVLSWKFMMFLFFSERRP